ncbi:hypothetical protein BBP40_007425 [Aspergillus hancockii]|nr:hypothetical protein BBP40_007425 [Aspergillus hancockii]
MSSLGHELGILFAFLTACFVIMGIYVYFWRAFERREAQREKARKEQLAVRRGVLKRRGAIPEKMQDMEPVGRVDFNVMVVGLLSSGGLSNLHPQPPYCLMGSGQFDKAGILSHDLSGVEASSPGFTISPQELSELAAGFANSDNVMASGVHIGGEKFVAIRADDRSIYAKKGKEGIVIVKAKSCVMVAHHPENVQTPNAATVVENLVDYINRY